MPRREALRTRRGERCKATACRASAERCASVDCNPFFPRCGLGELARDLVRNIRRPIDPANAIVLRTVTTLQNFAGDSFRTENNRDRPCRSALLGVSVEGRHQIDFARLSFGDA